MVARDPAVRVAATRDTFAFIDRTVPGAVVQITARFPPQTRAAWESASRMGWFPVEHDHHVADATIAVLGAERAVELWRASVGNLIEQPLLRSFVSGMLTIFGDNRSRVVGLFPRAFSQIYRDFCDLELEQRDGGATLHFTKLADEVWQYPSYIETWRAAAMGTLDVAHLQGDVEVIVDQAGDRIDIDMRW